MLIVLDRQHRGKPSKPSDLGAGYDIDGDGRIAISEREAMLTGLMALAAEARLIELGHEVVPMSDGHYHERHERANARGADAYIALHLNAGHGDYGAVFHDYRSLRGPGLAESIAGVLSDTADELKRVRVIDARPTDWTANAYRCISGLAAPIGIVYEPCFMDSPDHAPLLLEQGQRRLGNALAVGIHRWSETRRK